MAGEFAPVELTYRTEENEQDGRRFKSNLFYFLF